MRRSCCARAIGRSVPSRESRTRRRCCLSPKTICVVRETAPFSLSLCCTKSDRRIVRLLQANPFPNFRGTGRLPQRSKHTPRRSRFFVASADYVPRARCGKVWCVLDVPDVQLRLEESRERNRREPGVPAVAVFIRIRRRCEFSEGTR